MSYSYLFESRLRSQRVRPARDPCSIDALLNLDDRTHLLLKAQTINNDPKGVATYYEPPPLLNYELLYILIRLARPYLDRRDMKRFDYLNQGRDLYFQGLRKSHAAYIEMQSASAYEKILAARSETVAQVLQQRRSSSANDTLTGPDSKTPTIKLEREMVDIETARRKNNEDLRQLLLVLENRVKSRDETARWLSGLKWKFLKTEVPWLVDIGKHVFSQQKASKGMI